MHQLSTNLCLDIMLENIFVFKILICLKQSRLYKMLIFCQKLKVQKSLRGKVSKGLRLRL